MTSFRNKDPLSELHASIKWLIASSGATAAILVAGLQLASLTEASAWSAAAGAIFAALAIFVALRLLFRAAKILTIPRPAVLELTHKEFNDEHALNEPQTQLPNDPDLKWIHEQKEWLLDGASSISALYSDMTGARNALAALQRGKPGRWEDRKLDPQNEADKNEMYSIYEATQSKLVELEDVLHYHLSYQEFDKLMRHFPVLALVFTVAVLGFAVAPLLNL